MRALKKYNGTECSRRMLGLMDAGHINPTDFRRIVLLNKVAVSQIADFTRRSDEPDDLPRRQQRTNRAHP